ncbi:MAG: pilus assembly protein [Armatimonadetes bacterium]|nr:pilus assembly protein [Armatimonadota bacterium]
MHSLGQRRRGNSMVEMAIALPLFMLFLWGIFTFGMIYSHQLAINTAAREGARHAVVGHTDDEVTALVRRMTPQLSHDASRFQLIIDRNTERTAVNITYTEKVVGVPPLTTLFNNKQLRARSEHRYESVWMPR